MTQQEWIISRLQEVDRFRWDGWIDEAEYQELAAHWRAVLAAVEFVHSCED